FSRDWSSDVCSSDLSRGIGNNIGKYFIQLARKEMERHQMNLPDRDLAYFREGSQYFDDYVDAVEWAQDYARANRQHMMRLVLQEIGRAACRERGGEA